MSASDYFSRAARMFRRAARMDDLNKVAESMKGDKKRRLTTQNAGVQALQLVRDLFDHYRLPSSPKLSYSGVRGLRVASNSSDVEDGVVTIHAEFRTRSGVNVGIDIPVEIHRGDLLEPSVILHDGAPRVIAQSTFDGLVARNTLYEEQPLRALYSPPMDKQHDQLARANRIKVERVNTGMFSVQAAREVIRKAINGHAIVADYDDEGNWVKPWEQKKTPIPVPTEEHVADEEEVVAEKEAQTYSQRTSPKMGPVEITTPLPKLRNQDWSGQYGYGNTPPQGQMVNDREEMLTKQDSPAVRTKPSAPKLQPALTQPMNTLPQNTDQVNMENALGKTVPSVPWPRAASPEDYDAEDKHEKPDPDRNQQEGDWNDPAERKDQHDLWSGMEVSLKEELEVKERGGAALDLAKGTKCTILRDHAGDNKSFVVEFEDGLQAIVERHFLKSAAKPPKKEKPFFKVKKQPKMCPKCNKSPCVCHKKKSEKVNF